MIDQPPAAAGRYPSDDMGGMRQSESGTGDGNKFSGPEVHKADGHPCSQLDFTSRNVVGWSFGIMVSAWFLARAFVVTSVWANGWAQYVTECKYPPLLDATAEELTLGLERGDFNSVDLVKVYF